LHRAIHAVGDEIAGRDAVFVTAPDYFAVKLIQLSRRVDGAPLPRRWRALSFGPQTVTGQRTDEQTLKLAYDGGILADPLMELYRDRRLPTPPGYRVALEGLRIEVTETTDDGRARGVAFRFDVPLENDRFRFYAWSDEGRYVPFALPAIGASSEL